jgi:hypothetical protein
LYKFESKLPVSRAIHGLESVSFLLDLKAEHVIGIMFPMAGGLPQLGVVNVWGDDLFEASLPVLFSQKFHKAIVNCCSFREEEARAGTQFVEEEQLLLLFNFQINFL